MFEWSWPNVETRHWQAELSHFGKYFCSWFVISYIIFHYLNIHLCLLLQNTTRGLPDGWDQSTQCLIVTREMVWEISPFSWGHSVGLRTVNEWCQQWQRVSGCVKLWESPCLWDVGIKPGLTVIKIPSYSARLRMKFILSINIFTSKDKNPQSVQSDQSLCCPHEDSIDPYSPQRNIYGYCHMALSNRLICIFSGYRRGSDITVLHFKLNSVGFVARWLICLLTSPYGHLSTSHHLHSSVFPPIH